MLEHLYILEILGILKILEVPDILEAPEAPEVPEILVLEVPEVPGILVAHSREMVDAQNFARIDDLDPIRRFGNLKLHVDEIPV